MKQSSSYTTLYHKATHPTVKTPPWREKTKGTATFHVEQPTRDSEDTPRPTQETRIFAAEEIN